MGTLLIAFIFVPMTTNDYHCFHMLVLKIKMIRLFSQHQVHVGAELCFCNTLVSNFVNVEVGLLSSAFIVFLF